MQKPRTLGELKKSGYRSRSVKEEMRQNLIRKLGAQETIFPGILGFDDSVIPQIANAILARHNFILLGLRGQAKSRILRSLVGLLDDAIPYVAGCEINDDPLAPICRACVERLEECKDATAIEYLPREQRYVEKLAAPELTIADIILYSALDFGASVGQPIDPSLKYLNAWFKRVSERPSAKSSLHPASAQAGMKG